MSRVRITALVRGEERARQLSERGVLRFELFENLDQVELLEDIASRYDSTLLPLACKEAPFANNGPPRGFHFFQS